MGKIRFGLVGAGAIAASHITGIEKAEGAPGEEIVLDKVLLVQDQDDLRVGKPFLEGVRVRAEILAQRRAKKIVVFKFKRRKGYRKKAGHRQYYTGIRIKAIETA